MSVWGNMHICVFPMHGKTPFVICVCIRLSPSDGDSLASEASSGRESAEESTRPAVTPSDSKPHHRKSKHGNRHSFTCVYTPQTNKNFANSAQSLI